MSAGEFEIVRWITERFPLAGDDAAVVEAPTGSLLLAADAIVGGVDFTEATPPEDIGYRAVLANASDIAAMGGEPRHLLVTVVAPPGTEVQRVLEGVAAGARAHGCEVAGGDLSSTTGPLVVSVAITGVVPDGAPVLRSGARPGDAVFVTGPLGGAAARGYEFGPQRPRARVGEGTEARRRGATAMIDVSDGLAADLTRLLDASGVGVVLTHVPVAAGATEAHALGGGDDYELAFTLPAGVEPPPGAIRVGTVTADRAQRPPAVPGWEHQL